MKPELKKYIDKRIKEFIAQGKSNDWIERWKQGFTKKSMKELKENDQR